MAVNEQLVTLGLTSTPVLVFEQLTDFFPWLQRAHAHAYDLPFSRVSGMDLVIRIRRKKETFSPLPLFPARVWLARL